jgi:hypothetical protein
MGTVWRRTIVRPSEFRKKVLILTLLTFAALC